MTQEYRNLEARISALEANLTREQRHVRQVAAAVADTPPLLNSRQLAAALNVSASFILAMKRAGYQFTHGHQTTLEHALAWRAAFPTFRSRFYLQKDWEQQPKFQLP